ncbi:MAG: hypothetical protein ACI94Y_002927 [Maribacter sp.]|jgi:hypothetical protein
MKNKNKLSLAIIVIFLCIGMYANAQKSYIPLNNSYLQKTEAELLKNKNRHIHTAIKPYSAFEISHITDSIHQELRFEKELNKKFSRWLYDAAFNDNFLELRDKKNNKYSLILNPLMDIRSGYASDLPDSLTNYVNTRGVQVMGHIGKTLTFYSDVYENQARFPGYVNQFVKENFVVPGGQGFPKRFDSQLTTTNDRAFDFAAATGQITYQPNEFFNIQMGHGKNFIGDGYRSMLMSDNHFNYPYLKIRTSFWKLNYTNLYTQMIDIPNGVSQSVARTTFDKKYVVSHYLSINATKRFNIGLFESVVHQDSTGTFELNYLNPIILYRPVEFALGSNKGNVLIGITMSYKMKEKSMFYTQLAIDEFKFSEILKNNGWWANKFAFQLGFKSYDTFTPGLKVQTEINLARPYTYSHGTSGRSYGHYNESLAHPLGANFIESMNIISYQKGRWFGELELMYAVQGLDSLGTNVGSDIFRSYTEVDNKEGNKIGQGIKTTTLYTDLKLGYVINPKYNLRAELGMTYRSYNPSIETDDLKKLNTTYIYFGITTALTNKYYDF